MYVRYTVLVQKGNTDIIKVVHVTSVKHRKYISNKKYKYNHQCHWTRLDNRTGRQYNAE